MKKRTFFTTLFLFLIFFNAAIVLLTTLTLRDNLHALKERCLTEHYIIASSLIKDMQALEGRGISAEDVIDELMYPYLYFSQSEKPALAVYRNERLIFTNIDNMNPLHTELSEHLFENRSLSIRGGQSPVLSIAGRLPTPYQEYALEYQYDISPALAEWRQMKNTLHLSGGVFSVLLALCLLLLLNSVFRPLGQISSASRDIASGNYKNRLPVFGNDELTDLSRNFNHMVDEIENQMAALQDAAAQKQRFIDNFAHELRTPLTTIYGYAEYIQKAAIAEEDRFTAVGYILSECKRMENMAGQLLDLALLRGSETALSKISVSELLGMAQVTMHQKSSEKSVRILYEQRLDYLTANRDLLQILLLNLIDNAIKACVEGGRIVVRADLENGKPMLSVEDNGKGMSADELSHIKDAFYMSDKARTRQNGGAGLGLTICEQIAQIHNAELRFSSCPSKGTTASIIFLQLDDKSVIT